MGKILAADKMRMETLHEQGLAAKSVVKAYHRKQWKLSSVQTICGRIDKTGSSSGASVIWQRTTEAWSPV